MKEATNSHVFFERLMRFLKKTKTSTILIVLIILSVARLIVLYSERDGHHVDETWCLGFANSYYAPHIYLDNDREERYLEEWITGKVFKDYITVSEEERFSFDSVLFNKHDDLSPALYELILHFVCSFFPDSFSWNYVFIINVLVFVPTLILVFYVPYELTSSRFCGFLTLIYYVLSGCGTANFLYLRTYHLVTLFTLLTFYLIILIIKHHENKKLFWYFILSISTILGSLTHYYYLVIAFYLTAFSIFLLLKKKRIKEAFILGSVMLLSVVVFFAIYPQSLLKLMPYTSGESTTGYYSYPYSWNLSAANLHFFTGVLGFHIGFTLAGILEAIGLIVLLVAIVLLLSFLFRNENWFKTIKSGVKTKSISAFQYGFSLVKSIDSCVWVGLFSPIAYLFTIPYSAMIYSMGYTERYFFSAMTVFLLSIVSVLTLLLKNLLISIKGKKAVSCIVTLVSLILFSLMCYNSNSLVCLFRFDNMGEAELKERLSGKDCYVYVASMRDTIWLSSVLYDSGDIYIESKASITDEHIFPDIEPGSMVLIVNENFLTEEQMEQLSESGTYSCPANDRQRLIITLDGFVEMMEKDTGCDISFVNEYNTFIGSVELYECN